MLTGKHRHRHAEAQFARWVDDGRRDRRDAMDQHVDVDRPSFLACLLDIVKKSLERGFRLVADGGIFGRNLGDIEALVWGKRSPAGASKAWQPWGRRHGGMREREGPG